MINNKKNKKTFKRKKVGSEKNKKLIIFALILISISVGFLGYVYYSGEKNNEFFSIEKLKEALSIDNFLNKDKTELKGELFLTLRYNDEDSYPDIFSYNIESDTLKKTLGLGEGDMNININSVSSPTEDKVAYVSFPQKNWSEYLQQIHVYDRNSNTIKRITKSDKTSRKRLPEWSPNEKRVAFTGWTPKEGEFSVKIGPVEQYGVYVTDLKGNEKFITKGADPRWLPFGENLILMKNDGIHLYDTNGVDQGLIWEAKEGVVYSNNHIDVSQDGLKIAWTSPDWGEVAVMYIDSWSPFKIKDVSIIKSHAFWPVFSPDNNTLLLQEVDWEELANDPDPQLVAYNLENLNSQNVLNLDDYDQNYMFLTDWKY